MRQTKVVTKFLAAALALGLCGIADANTASTKHKGIHGVIVSVQKGSSQITVRIGSAKKGDAQTLKVTVGPNTTIEGKAHASGSFSTLHAGDRIILEPDATSPTTIIDLGHGHGRRANVQPVVVVPTQQATSVRKRR